MTTEVVSSHTYPTCFQYKLPTQSLLSCALLGATKMAEPEDEPPPVLLPCSICSRTFKPESLQKHIKACEKQLTKKRKVFDSSKQRIQGTELAEFLPIILREKKTEKVPVKKQESKWKEKHLEFVRAIRAARGVEVESSKSVPITRSNHEKCPHCDRNFGPKAFDRHVEWCKEQKARIPKSPGSIQAKERLEARTKYRAPPLAKSKRTLTREKYAKVTQHTQDLSPMGSRSNMTFSKVSQNYHPEPKISETSHKSQGVRNKPKVSASSPSCVLPSGNLHLKRREPSPSPSKRPIRSKNIGKSGLAKQKNEEASHRENTFTSSSNTAKSHQASERSVREKKPTVVEKRLPVPRASLTVQKTQERKAGQSKIPSQILKYSDGSTCKSLGPSDLHPQGKTSLQSKPSVTHKCVPSNVFSEEGSLGVIPMSLHDSEGHTSCESVKRADSRAHASMSRRQKPKLNDIDVNNDNEGLTVSPCSILKADDNFITWKDIAKNTESVLKRNNTDLESDDCNRTYTVVSSCTDDSQNNNDVENNVTLEELNCDELYSLAECPPVNDSSKSNVKDIWKPKSESCADLLVDRKSCLKKQLMQVEENTSVCGKITLNGKKIQAVHNDIPGISGSICNVSSNGESSKEDEHLNSALPATFQTNREECTSYETVFCNTEETEGCKKLVNCLELSDLKSIVHPLQSLSSDPENYECYSNINKPCVENVCFSGNKDLIYNTLEEQRCERDEEGGTSSEKTMNIDIDRNENYNVSCKALFSDRNFCLEKGGMLEITNTFHESTSKLASEKNNSMLENVTSVKEKSIVDVEGVNCSINKSCPNANEEIKSNNDTFVDVKKEADFISLFDQLPGTYHTNPLLSYKSSNNAFGAENLKSIDLFGCNKIEKQNERVNFVSVQDNIKIHCIDSFSRDNASVSTKNYSGEAKDTEFTSKHKVEKHFPFCRKSCFCCFEKSGELTQEQAFTIWQSCKKEALDFLGLSDSIKSNGSGEIFKSNEDVIDSIWDLASQEFIRVMKQKSENHCSTLQEDNLEIYDSESIKLEKDKFVEKKEKNVPEVFAVKFTSSASKSKIPFLSKTSRPKIHFSDFKRIKKHKKIHSLTKTIKRMFYIDESIKNMFFCKTSPFSTMIIKSEKWTSGLHMRIIINKCKKTHVYCKNYADYENDSEQVFTFPKQNQIENSNIQSCDKTNSNCKNESILIDAGENGHQNEDCAIEQPLISDSKPLRHNNIEAQILKNEDSIKPVEEVEEISRVNSALENVTIRTFGIMDPSEINVFTDNYHEPAIQEVYQFGNYLLEQDCDMSEDAHFSSLYSPSLSDLKENININNAQFDEGIDETKDNFSDGYYQDSYLQGENCMYDSVPFYEVGDQYFISDHIFDPIEMCAPEMPYTFYIFPEIQREGCVITEYFEDDNLSKGDGSLDDSEVNVKDSYVKDSGQKENEKKILKKSFHERESEDSLEKVSQVSKNSHNDLIPHTFSEVDDNVKLEQSSINSRNENSASTSEKSLKVKLEHFSNSLNGSSRESEPLSDMHNSDLEIVSQTDSVGIPQSQIFEQHSYEQDSVSPEHSDNDFSSSMCMHQDVSDLDITKEFNTLKIPGRNKLKPDISINESHKTKRKKEHTDEELNKNTASSRRMNKKHNEVCYAKEVRDECSHNLSPEHCISKHSLPMKLLEVMSSSSNSSPDSLEKAHTCNNLRSSIEIYSSDEEKVMDHPEMSSSSVIPDNSELKNGSYLSINFPSFLYESMDCNNGNVKVWTNSIKQKNKDVSNIESKRRTDSARSFTIEDSSKNTNFSEKLQRKLHEVQTCNDLMYEKEEKKNIKGQPSKRIQKEKKNSLKMSNRYTDSVEGRQTPVENCHLLNQNEEILDIPAKFTNPCSGKNSKSHKNKIILPDISDEQAPKMKSAKEHNASLSKLVEKWTFKQKNLKSSQSEQDVSKKNKPEQFQQKRQTRKIHRLPPMSALPKYQIKTRTKLPRVPGGRVLPSSPNLRLFFRKAFSSEEVYDPYVSAERQMMELLSQGDYVHPTVQQKKNVPLSNSESAPKFPSFESSHKSAFVSPESLRNFPSSKSHYEKGDADKKINEENYVYKLEAAKNEQNTQSKLHSTGGKFNADSAYGSLNRRSPGNKKPEKHDVEVAEGERVCIMSSSSSESSLPPLCSVQVVKCEGSNPSLSPTPSLAVSASPVTQNVPRMSKFCHECGSKYPVSLAKFCCECGVRRLAM